MYKPDQRHSCCPHYTIRLPVAELRTSKGQRQALHRWNKFVLGDDYISKASRLHAKTRDEKRKAKNEFDLITTVHEAETSQAKRPPEPAHKFSVGLESNEFTEEKYAVFENYQRQVHEEAPHEITRRGFERFLCTSPLPNGFVEDERGRRKTGSYHQCYRLDGRLFAIGVIDLLPNGVSAVYFLYHSDFEEWSFGKLSALREAAFAKENGYTYYNMGYYIHSCKKMRYKAEFKPQYVLDPESYTWDKLDEYLTSRLDENHYISLSADRAREQQNGSLDDEAHKQAQSVTDDWQMRSLFDLKMPGVPTVPQLEEQIDLDRIQVIVKTWHKTVILPASQLKSWSNATPSTPQTLKGVISELAACTGPDVAREMIVSLG